VIAGMPNVNPSSFRRLKVDGGVSLAGRGDQPKIRCSELRT
jgi:hypothetical protein